MYALFDQSRRGSISKNPCSMSALVSEVDDDLAPHGGAESTDTVVTTTAIASAADRTREIHEATRYILSQLPVEYHNPRVGIICGSGLSYLGEVVENAVHIPYADIPHFPSSTKMVQGHGNKMVIGKMHGVICICLLGRYHMYEGHSIHDIAFPVYVLADLTVDSVVLTNSAGALDDSFEVGDIMVIEDHISLVCMSGFSPLRGENLEEFGPRFPSMTAAYYEKSYELALGAGVPAAGVAATGEGGGEGGKCREGARGCRLQRGVYVGVGGPSFETKAEVKYLTLMGGHAVGMSTTPEAICATHASLRVVALSLITNTQKSGVAPSHEEVLSATESSSRTMVHLVTHVVGQLGTT